MFEVTTEIIVGVSFGLAVGVGPAITVGTLGAVGEHVNRRFSGRQSIAVAFVLAVGNAYAVGLIGAPLSTVRPQAPRLALASVVVATLAVYANSHGRRIGSELPVGTSRRLVRGRSLSADAIESVDAAGQVSIQSTGGVRDLEGYPSLSPNLRRSLEDETWRLPADLPLSELERRLETRLRTTYDLSAVSVSIDARARATIAAAPPTSTTESRIPEGWRSISIEALIPTGLCSGETVVLSIESDDVEGIVLGTGSSADVVSNEGDPGEYPSLSASRSADGTDGGGGRLTVAVPAEDAGTLLRSKEVHVAVPAGETTATLEAFGLLDQAGYAVRKFRVGDVVASVEAGTVDEDGFTPIVANDGPNTHRRSIVEPKLADLESRADVFVVAEPATINRLDGSVESAKSGETVPSRELDKAEVKR
ncbi:hypothetical protein AB7C87_12695 [Natrarchaeobius sp. A-rgal3]|uniref:hypothetical protein n=1 Tax=Natrarchaeobius versutus TaxID=1679078 RepID=UPI0035102FB0